MSLDWGLVRCIALEKFTGALSGDIAALLYYLSHIRTQLSRYRYPPV